MAPKTVARIADHPAGLIGAPKRRPAITGHSFGGLLPRILAGRGLSAASVVIDPAPFGGVLPLPVSPRRDRGITETIEMRGRGHTPTIDHGWQEVADTALAFVTALRPISRHHPGEDSP
ncbi:hypothetical protein [Streptomyces sp.]|uniref:hypothetical protein n=1 Tax=Streptomyces sp. TaxID=1931 RepID=UPI002811FBAD|nr:hypothetical protein [Streptomyces sp.]